MEHIKAWDNEYKSSTWKGHYSLGDIDSCSIKGRILDAGCGSGKYTLPLGMRGYNVIGIDVSTKALGMARSSSTKHGIDIEFIAGDLYHLPFADNSFDAVLCYGVLQHLLSKERELALSEFRRILVKGGLLFIEVFGKEDMRYGGTEIEPDTFSRKSGIIYHYFDIGELEGLLECFSVRISESRKEKRFKGRTYTRHMINAAAKKT
jgi:ubiquinone/menaquinone biosynthesis C-methylase UbiE